MKASQKLLESQCLKETFPLKSECLSLCCNRRGKVYFTLSAFKYSSANENEIDRSFLFCAENLGVFTFNGGAAIFDFVVIEIWENDLITMGTEGRSKNLHRSGRGGKSRNNMQIFLFCLLTMPLRYNMGNMGNYYSLTHETMFFFAVWRKQLKNSMSIYPR